MMRFTLAFLCGSSAMSVDDQVLVHNSDPTSTYQLSLDGPFSSVSWTEFQSTVLMAPQDCSATLNRSSFQAALHDSDLPTHVDWRDAGVVSGVKNQGRCGSCWTFSSSGAMEAHHAIKYKSWRTSEMSEQQLLDCAIDFDNHGCEGGLPSHAFEYIHHAGGLSKEFAYPYRAASSGDKSACRWVSGETNKTSLGGTTVSSFNVTEGDEESLKRIVATLGPVSVAFQVVEDFRLYKRGIYSTEKCMQGPQDVNHAVLVVGYGQAPETGKPYWIVKNSWGPEWGEEGYFKIERGRNMCGIATCASYPVLGEVVTTGLSDASPQVINA